MELLCPFSAIVVIGIFVYVYSNYLANVAREAQRIFSEAQAAYETSLKKLRETPTSPELRQQTLELGRHYSNLARVQQGVSIFDEIALKNDIDAACAGAVNVVTASQTSHMEDRTRDERECPYCAEQILRKAKICKHCGHEVPAIIRKQKPMAHDAIASSFASDDRATVTCVCGKTIRLERQHAGKKVKCPSCGEIGRIPL